MVYQAILLPRRSVTDPWMLVVCAPTVPRGLAAGSRAVAGDRRSIRSVVASQPPLPGTPFSISHRKARCDHQTHTAQVNITGSPNGLLEHILRGRLLGSVPLRLTSLKDLKNLIEMPEREWPRRAWEIPQDLIDCFPRPLDHLGRNPLPAPLQYLQRDIEELAASMGGGIVKSDAGCPIAGHVEYGVIGEVVSKYRPSWVDPKAPDRLDGVAAGWQFFFEASAVPAKNRIAAAAIRENAAVAVIDGEEPRPIVNFAGIVQPADKDLQRAKSHDRSFDQPRATLLCCLCGQ